MGQMMESRFLILVLSLPEGVEMSLEGSIDPAPGHPPSPVMVSVLVGSIGEDTGDLL